MTSLGSSVLDPNTAFYASRKNQYKSTDRIMKMSPEPIEEEVDEGSNLPPVRTAKSMSHLLETRLENRPPVMPKPSFGGINNELRIFQKNRQRRATNRNSLSPEVFQQLTDGRIIKSTINEQKCDIEIVAEVHRNNSTETPAIQFTFDI